MSSDRMPAETIDGYIAGFPQDVQTILEPMPFDLITRVVKLKVRQSQATAASRTKRNT